MPAFDALLMSKTTGNLTTNCSGVGVTIRKSPIGGLAARVVIPDSAGTTNSVLPRVLASADDSTYVVIAQYEGGPFTMAKDATKEVMIPFVTSKKYVLVDFVIGGTGTAGGFGAVQAGIVNLAGNDWAR